MPYVAVPSCAGLPLTATAPQTITHQAKRALPAPHMAPTPPHFLSTFLRRPWRDGSAASAPAWGGSRSPETRRFKHILLGVLGELKTFVVKERTKRGGSHRSPGARPLPPNTEVPLDPSARRDPRHAVPMTSCRPPCPSRVTRTAPDGAPSAATPPYQVSPHESSPQLKTANGTPAFREKPKWRGLTPGAHPTLPAARVRSGGTWGASPGVLGRGQLPQAAEEKGPGSSIPRASSPT